MKYIILYLILINAVSFLLMIVDKYKAKRNLWRIPERTLFLLASLGGSIGILAGIHLIRHKSKHLSFTIGVPVILGLQLIAGIILHQRFFS